MAESIDIRQVNDLNNLFWPLFLSVLSQISDTVQSQRKQLSKKARNEK